MITQTRLKELFFYKHGKLLRKIGVRGSPMFTEIGTIKPKGYRVAVVDGKMYRVHHLVWIYHYGEKAPELDHINRDRDDNRIENLRLCTHAQNLGNMRARVHKYKGVTFDKVNNKWRAQITIDYAHVCLGRYLTIEEAALAYNKAAKDYFGEFALLNEVDHVES
jgi:HNH endonuclease/AP2 domain